MYDDDDDLMHEFFLFGIGNGCIAEELFLGKGRTQSRETRWIGYDTALGGVGEE